MKLRFAMIPALVVLVASSVFAFERRATPKEPLKVSMLDLLNNPSRYEGKVVNVKGYVHIFFEDTAIYLHREDYLNRLGNNYWIEPPDSWKGGPCDAYMDVTGTFTTRRHGAYFQYNGEINHVTKFEFWSDPDHPMVRISEEQYRKTSEHPPKGR